MAFSKKGRFYERGKGLSEELKGQIIDKILETGGDRDRNIGILSCKVDGTWR